jgi:hypothetical protein
MGEPPPVLCQFYRLIPGAPIPRRADRSAGGTLPVHALRYCEPVACASGFGWYLFPPISFKLMLDGNEIFWTYEGADGWMALKVAQYPDFVKIFAGIAPAGLEDLAPTFLGQGLLPGVVQIWSGYLARTAPGWGLLSRGTANISKTQAYENYEGIIETDSWFGPLFTNIRLTRSNAPVEFIRGNPLLQVQPVRRDSYLDPGFKVLEATDMGTDDWARFAETMTPNSDHNRALGRYAVETRRRLRGQETER